MFTLCHGSMCSRKVNILWFSLPLSLPLSLQWGYVVITTPDGVLDHEEAIRHNVGGQVLGYFH